MNTRKIDFDEIFPEDIGPCCDGCIADGKLRRLERYLEFQIKKQDKKNARIFEELTHRLDDDYRLKEHEDRISTLEMIIEQFEDHPIWRRIERLERIITGQNRLHDINEIKAEERYRNYGDLSDDYSGEYC